MPESRSTVAAHPTSTSCRKNTFIWRPPWVGRTSTMIRSALSPSAWVWLNSGSDRASGAKEPTYLQMAVRAAAAIGDRPREGTLAQDLASMEANLGHKGRAREWYAYALEIWRAWRMPAMRR